MQGKEKMKLGYQRVFGHCLVIFYITSACLMTLLTGCKGMSSEMKDVQALQSKASNEKVIADYLIQPGDQLDIKFFYNPELNETVIVRPDGKISLQLVDELKAAGVSPAQLDQLLTTVYARELREPELTVIVRQPNAQVQQVYVGGEVGRPGMVPLIGNMTPLQAIIQAQGFSETANMEEVVIIRKGPNAEPIPYRMNVQDMVDGEPSISTFTLNSLDVIYVSKSKIAEINKFVREYLKDLAMFSGFNFGFTYRLDPSTNN
jgi:protein involved in polysaccharide export with SLBB domain